MHHLIVVSFLFTSLFVGGFAQADLKQFQYQKMLELADQVLDNTSLFKWLPPIWTVPDDETIQESGFDQRLDHASCCDLTTFRQRYYYDGSLAKGTDAPVFLYICGESTCEPRSLNGIIREHAARFGAHLIALEHRYYGKSQPFEKLSVGNLRFLSTESALRDVATFAAFAKNKHALTGKWVSFGGSYPGSLSAYLREKLPGLVVGAIASSAPVRAEANFEEYDLHVAQVAGERCTNSIREVVSRIESAIGTPQMAVIKKIFDAEKVKDDTDFLYVVADVGAAAIQYGFDKDFCLALDVADKLAGYGQFAQVVYKKFGMSAERMSMFEGATSEDPNDYLEGFGYRQWLYQSCTEYGYWQNAYHDAALSMRSSRINAAYHKELCGRLFQQQSEVNTAGINEGFYSPLFSNATSRIIFTNGNQDPWSRLSIVEGQQLQQNDKLTLHKIMGAAHCDDLRKSKVTDSEALKAARALTITHIEEWLR